VSMHAADRGCFIIVGVRVRESQDWRIWLAPVWERVLPETRDVRKRGFVSSIPCSSFRVKPALINMYLLLHVYLSVVGKGNNCAFEGWGLKRIVIGVIKAPFVDDLRNDRRDDDRCDDDISVFFFEEGLLVGDILLDVLEDAL